MEYMDRVKQAADYISSRIPHSSELAVILGTGLGGLANEIEQKTVLKYAEIPNFPLSTVEGHAGELIGGFVSGKYILAMNGRFHYYEGYSMRQVVFPVRVFTMMGIKTMLISNASGGMNPEFRAGDLMAISDHINLMGDNPLIGKNLDQLGPRFPDMSEAYSRKLIRVAEGVSHKLGFDIRKGVYAALAGPNYETPAELRMLRALGADAVGMSTVPEVIAARHGGLEVLGISCITDIAIADGLQVLDHEKVVKTANSAKAKFVNLVKGIIEKI